MSFTAIPACDDGEMEQTICFGLVDISPVVERNGAVKVISLYKGKHRNFAVGSSKDGSKSGLNEVCQRTVLALRLPACAFDDRFLHTEGSLYFHHHTS